MCWFSNTAAGVVLWGSLIKINPCIVLFHLDLGYRVNLPDRSPLRTNRAGVFEVIQEPPAYSNRSVLVDNVIQIGLLPLVKWSGARSSFNDNGLADVTKISG